MDNESIADLSLRHVASDRVPFETPETDPARSQRALQRWARGHGARRPTATWVYVVLGLVVEAAVGGGGQTVLPLALGQDQ